MLAGGVNAVASPAWADPQPPEPVEVVGPDRVSVAEAREMTSAVRDAALAAASDAGASAALLVEGTMPMLRLRRGTTVIQKAPGRARFPMTFTALDAGPASAVYGEPIGTTIGAGQLVMSEATASLRGAQLGDLVDLRGWNGKVVTFTLGAISPDAPSELVMTTAMALTLGVTRLARIVIWGFADRDTIETALSAHALVSTKIRLYRSWEPRYADDVLSQSRVKAMAGEFAVTGSGNSLHIVGSWASQNVVRIPLQLGTRTIRARCHKVVAAALQAVFQEITAAGLDTTIRYRGTNTTAGCFNAREARSLGSTSGGSVSRHTWAIAMDFNTVSNCLGCVPTQDCRLVQIFRAHGFAWGGNFLTPDGMHFEYVGEPRDTVPTRPGAYCPILPEPPPPTTTTTASTTTTTA